MVEKLSLRQRMIIGFGIVLICFIGALGFGIYGIRSNSSQLERLVEVSREASVANSIKENFLNSVIAFKSHVDNGNQKSIEEFDKNHELLLENISSIKAISTNQQRKDYVDLISDDVRLLSLRFDEVKKINAELADEYIILADTGYRMLDELDLIKEVTSTEAFNSVHHEVTDSIEALLFARLHASKFFNFHTEEEFLSYQSEYNKFLSLVESIGLLSDVESFSDEYIRLKNDMKLYNDGMQILHDKIENIDNILAEVEEINPKVNSLVNRFVDSTKTELKDTQKLGSDNNNRYNIIMGILSILALLLSIYVVFKILDIVLVPINYLRSAFEELTEGDTNTEFRLEINSNDEIGVMSQSFNEFMVKLGELIKEVHLSNYIKTANNDMTSLVRDEMNIAYMSERLLTYLINYTQGVVGSFYVSDDKSFTNYSTYAHTLSEFDKSFEIGESYLGEVVKEGKVKVIKDLESISVESNFRLKTSLVDKSVNELVLIPCVFEGSVNALVEIGFMHRITNEELMLFGALSLNLGALVNSARTRIKMKNLLDRTMHQAEELQMQQEELKQSNEELEEQTRALRESESRLQAQQEELRVSNEELEERSKQLEIQKSDLDLKNKAIISSREDVLIKAQELELANRYKTEFLANMSHELRTPLNSILVLSQLLEDRNNSQPLSSKEVEFARTINRSGNDLLTLINGVLDLSKVEAGKLELHIEKSSVESIIRDNVGLFQPLTEIKKIEFMIDNQFPEGFEINTDSMRINQITKNLLSNAIKFTHEGFVKLTIRKPYQSEINRFKRHAFDDIVFEVKDTGIGIPVDKQKMIFEAFKQNDGSTARSYGGTGLGLTIALQLAEMMSGTIYLESQEGEGSNFVFITPIDLQMESKEDEKSIDKESNVNEAVTDIKEAITDANKDAEEDNSIIEDNIVEEIILEDKDDGLSKLLIIEDDEVFANLLKDLCSEKGYHSYICHTGFEGIEKAKEIMPDGIILDMGLPDIEGMEVAKILGETQETSSIPIHIISGDDADTSLSVPKSIIGFLKKPVDIKSIYQTLSKIEEYSNKGLKKLLVVGSCGGEDFDSFKNLGEIEVVKVASGSQAIDLLENDEYGCVVLDAQLDDMRGVEFLATINRKTDEKIPIIIYTEKEIESKEYNHMKEFTSSIILKSSKSKERLTDEVNLFLHDMKNSLEKYGRYSSLSKELMKENIKEKIYNENSLSAIRLLLADDDDRNVFALTHALEQYGMEILVAEDGRRALDLFKSNEVDIILMDIMMPEMDGYEAIRSIRQLHDGKDIPIIALTAKAMKEDREKCIQAGANDYMTKPIDVNKLTSLIKVWLA